MQKRLFFKINLSAKFRRGGADGLIFGRESKQGNDAIALLKIISLSMTKLFVFEFSRVAVK